MPDITAETIKNLTILCRIGCSEEEQQLLLKDLRHILEYFEQLRSMDTTDIPPCTHVLANIVNIVREDKVANTLSQNDFLTNAPAHTNKLVRIPPVLEVIK